MKKDGRGGARKGAGRPKGSIKGDEKNKRFLGTKVSEKEFGELSSILQKGKDKTGLKTVELIKKLFYDFATKENIKY